MNNGTGMTSHRTRLRLIELLREQGIQNEEVLGAMEQIPRHLFVDNALSHRAYENVPLPIGENQTISQPYTVARISELLLNGLRKMRGKRTKVLEIGCGCGYQTAVLSFLFSGVYGVDRIHGLYEKAQANLKRTNVHNVHLAHKDGKDGWKEVAPFDGIIISAATTQLPSTLLTQLNSCGCIIFPRGEPGHQRLRLITQKAKRQRIQDYDFVAFVPLLNGIKE